MPGAMTYTVGSGNREDLTDILYRITPEDTPVYSMTRTGEAATATLHEWQVDDLLPANTKGAVEGSDNTNFANAAANRARLSNQTQIVRRNYLVSKTQLAVSTAGVPDERASAVAKKMVEAKLDIDTTICSANDKSAGSASTPRQLRGIFSWISSSGPSDVPAEYRTPAESINADSNAITESEFLGICQNIWTVGGRLENFIVGPTLKKVMSGFIGRTGSGTGITTPAEAKKIVYSVNMYDTDFGVINIIPSRNLNATSTPGIAVMDVNDGVFLYQDAIELSWLRPLGHEELNDEGGGPRGMIEGEYTLVVKNPRGLGKHTNSA